MALNVAILDGVENEDGEGQHMGETYRRMEGCLQQVDVMLGVVVESAEKRVCGHCSSNLY
jgi:hypothetical protein